MFLAGEIHVLESSYKKILPYRQTMNMKIEKGKNEKQSDRHAFKNYLE